jgi:hypothetical protein
LDLLPLLQRRRYPDLRPRPALRTRRRRPPLSAQVRTARCGPRSRDRGTTRAADSTHGAL